MHIRVCSHTATRAALEQQLAYMLCSYTYCLSSSTALEQQLARVTAERDALVGLCDQTLPETRAGNDNNDKSGAAAAAGEHQSLAEGDRAPCAEKCSGCGYVYVYVYVYVFVHEA